MGGKDLGDGGRGIGVRPRRKTGGRRKWDARYTKKCITKVTDCQVICCVSFEWSGKMLRMRGLKGELYAENLAASGGLSIEHIPIITENPSQCRKLSVEHSPSEVIHYEILFPVPLFNLSLRLLD